MNNKANSIHGDEYEITNIESCGDCIACRNDCENGIERVYKTWTPEEVAQVCALVGESNKYLYQLRSLEEFE